MSRRRHVAGSSEPRAPLLVLAGFPNPVAANIANFLEGVLAGKPRVIATPSGMNDAVLYTQAYVTQLLRAVTEYAERQAKAHTPRLAPAHIILCYVPSVNDDALLNAFDFTVFPVKVPALSNYGDSGRQLRHDQDEAKRQLQETLSLALPVFQEVKRRLSSPSHAEPLFLPPKNFHLSGVQRLEAVFKDLTRGHRDWSDIRADVQLQALSWEELPKTLAHGVRKNICVDHRRLSFPYDHSNHGPGREILVNADFDDRVHFLRSVFRFGVPLMDGFHHDVQYPSRTLPQTEFDCCQDKRVTLKGSHANIYPNDFVRGDNKQKIGD